jgi:hypothetical protein
MFVLYVPYFAFVDQDAISVGDGFEHLNSGERTQVTRVMKAIIQENNNKI